MLQKYLIWLTIQCHVTNKDTNLIPQDTNLIPQQTTEQVDTTTAINSIG